MKRKTTKEILAESFRELAETRPIDKITVKDITSNCEYSTATFYRQFKDKYDLIAWSYGRDVEKNLERLTFDEAGWKQVLLDAAKYYYEHKEYLKNLLLHTEGYDSFVNNMTEINYVGLTRKIYNSYPQTKKDKRIDMMIRIYVIGTVGITCEWILGGYTAEPDVLSEVYEKAMPEMLREYLY
ncbi:MAG: TetR/AcrR family transcriptional regulator [Lachnospiraceae bacterium]|nr:TetR/AcrR family transcriptional regulator [Lachnospiraceae bacterium]